MPLPPRQPHPRSSRPRAGRCLLGLAAAFAACSTQAASADDAGFISAPAFSCAAGPFSAALPASYRALRRLGTLQSEAQGQAQQWEGYQTLERVLRFSGLELLVVTFSNDPDRYLLSSVVVSGPAWRVTGPFVVGGPAEPGLRALGIERALQSGVVRASGESDELVLSVDEGRVKRITYDCYTG